jgi:hypothetical protein
MSESATITAALGVFKKGRAGIWHYQAKDPSTTTLERVVDDAVKHSVSPAFFWWRETPALILEGDTTEDLIVRWTAWNVIFLVEDKDYIIRHLIRFPG